MMRVLFVVPTLNEADSIVGLCNQIINLNEFWDILVVDDGSTDGTGKLVSDLSRVYGGRVRILQRGVRLGIGSAHIAGISAAIRENYNRTVTMDADGSHDPIFAKDILNACEDNDLCIGSRYLKSNSLKGWTKWRKLLTYSVHSLTKATLGLKFDNSSGYRAYNVETLRRVQLSEIKSSNYDFFFESLLFFKLSGFKITEVPITLPTRTYGHSKLNLSLAVSALATLFKLTIRYRLLGKRKFSEMGTK